VKLVEQSVTRTDLYSLVWSEPMGGIAARFGISDVGLRKICDKAGKIGRRPALPVATGGSDGMIIIARSGIRNSDLDAELPDDISSLVTALRTEDGPLAVPQRARTHPLVAKLTAENRSRPKPIEFRRRRFLNVLFAEVELRGGRIATGERHDVKITIAGEPLDVTVREPWKMKREPPTDEERRKAWAEGRSPTSNPTGTLQLRIESWFDAPIRKCWRDGKDNPLEKQIRSILIGFLIAASFDRKRRIEREAEHHRQVLAERNRAAAEERRRKEKEQFDALIGEVSAWEQAARIRRYVEAWASARSQNCDAENADEWAEWARRLADRIDPILATRELRAHDT